MVFMVPKTTTTPRKLYREITLKKINPAVRVKVEQKCFYEKKIAPPTRVPKLPGRESGRERPGTSENQALPKVA